MWFDTNKVMTEFEIWQAECAAISSEEVAEWSDSLEEVNDDD